MADEHLAKLGPDPEITEARAKEMLEDVTRALSLCEKYTVVEYTALLLRHADRGTVHDGGFSDEMRAIVAMRMMRGAL
jgi:hypothetical protein